MTAMLSFNLRPLIQDRNLTSHTYNRPTAEAIVSNINGRYLLCFRQLRERLSQRLQEECE